MELGVAGEHADGRSIVIWNSLSDLSVLYSLFFFPPEKCYMDFCEGGKEHAWMTVLPSTYIGHISVNWLLLLVGTRLARQDLHWLFGQEGLLIIMHGYLVGLSWKKGLFSPLLKLLYSFEMQKKILKKLLIKKNSNYIFWEQQCILKITWPVYGDSLIQPVLEWLNWEMVQFCPHCVGRTHCSELRN